MLFCLLSIRPGSAVLWRSAKSSNYHFQPFRIQQVLLTYLESKLRISTSQGRKSWILQEKSRKHSNLCALDKEKEESSIHIPQVRDVVPQSKPIYRQGAFTLRKVTHRIRSSHPHLSPSRVLASWLDEESRSERLKYWKSVRGAVDESTLSVILLYHLHRSENNDLPTDPIDDYFVKQQNEALKRRGFSLNDVDQWKWVLQGETPDIIVERFLSLQSRRPSFLLLEVLRRDLEKVQSLKSMLMYVLSHVLLYQRPVPTQVLGDTNSEHIHGMERLSYLTLFKRLLHQSRRIWPSAMVSVAHMVEPYFRLSFQTETGTIELGARAHRNSCILYNEFIHALALPAFIDPLKSMSYNWRAQKVLLDMAATFSPPLTLDRSSYRAVAGILAASKKSERESIIAALRSRSWPPWRIYQDGMDELRSPRDDSSRVVSAIIAAKESGYPEGYEDTAMMILGGQEPDGTPTIHTRRLLDSKSLHAGTTKDKSESLLWTTRIYATRDVQEAWSAFQDFRHKGGMPDLQMYHAMFEKICFDIKRSLLELEEGHIGIPGDAKEVFPVPDQNYSEYWRTRLQPPTMEGLYKDMQKSGVKPAGRCLDFLVEHAPSVPDAVAYLQDSSLKRNVVQYLTDPNHVHAPRSLFRHLPMPTFGSFVKLLCRFAPKRTAIKPGPSNGDKASSGNPPNVQCEGNQETDSSRWMLQEMFLPVGTKLNKSRRNPLAHAIELVKQQKPRYRPVWNAIFAALAHTDVVIHPRLLFDSRNDIITCRVLNALLDDFHKCGMELDPEGFLSLCRCAEKSILASRNHSEIEKQPVLKFIDRVKNEFRTLSEADNSWRSLPTLLHDISGVHLHAYIRVLGLAEDYMEMILLLRWMAAYNNELLAVSNLSRNGASLMRKAIVSVAVFSKDSSYRDEVRQLIESVEHWGGWPQDVEIRRYMDS
ncbi:hypothetical protein F5884DRAFT_743914 [Xylogone sp. PMI_703]|nr:hypothetical protein F5884DRAFT_743914 [Xylogone sp. PMI_703]